MKIEILNDEILGDFVLRKGQQFEYTKIIQEGCGCNNSLKKHYLVNIDNRFYKISDKNAKVVQ
jgi:hypothetical protein